MDLDDKTASKAGALAAFGLTDQTLSELMFLSLEEVMFVKGTEAFKTAYAKCIGERAQRSMDLEEGWDLVEEKGLGQVLQKLEMGYDAKFALDAAVLANRARRRTPSTMGRVIDASKAGTTIVLSMNTQFVKNISTGENQAVLDVKPSAPAESLARRQHDIPSPKRVAEMLGVAVDKVLSKQNDKLRELERLGVVGDWMYEPETEDSTA